MAFSVLSVSQAHRNWLKLKLMAKKAVKDIFIDTKFQYIVQVWYTHPYIITLFTA